MYCSKCGTKLENEDMYCSKCGNRVLSEQTDAHRGRSISCKSESEIIRILREEKLKISILFIVLIMVFGVIYSSPNKKAAPENAIVGKWGIQGATSEYSKLKINEIEFTLDGKVLEKSKSEKYEGRYSLGKVENINNYKGITLSTGGKSIAALVPEKADRSLRIYDIRGDRPEILDNEYDIGGLLLVFEDEDTIKVYGFGEFTLKRIK